MGCYSERLSVAIRFWKYAKTKEKENLEDIAEDENDLKAMMAWDVL